MAKVRARISSTTISYTGNLHDRGVLGHPQFKGKPKLNVNATSPLSLSPECPLEVEPELLLPTLWFRDCPLPPLNHVGPQGAGEKVKVIEVEKPGEPYRRRDPGELYNLRTPIIIVLFFLVRKNQYVHSEIIFSVNGWISFHP